MIKTTSMLISELNNYKSPADKLSRMEKQGQVIQIIKGLYETNKDTAGYLLANSIYGPSYISFEYALSYHGLIPEAVYTVTCATFEKKKKKHYQTPFGDFSYRDIPSKVFYKGVELKQQNGYSYMMATAEKALCDQLYKISPVANYKELERLLFEDLRIDMSAIAELSKKDIDLYAQNYGSTNVKKLAGYMRKMR